MSSISSQSVSLDIFYNYFNKAFMLPFKTHARLFSFACVAQLLCSPAMAENITSNLQFNGYATAGTAWTNNAHGDSYLLNMLAPSSPSITRDPSMDYDSVVGLQFNYSVNDRANLITQLVADSDGSNSEVKANWAYIAYKMDDEFTVRAGRFAFPTYLYSENLRVGEAYPWARLPSEIYAALDGLYNINGIDLLYRHAFNAWNLTVQPAFGVASPAAVQAHNLTGITVNLSDDAWILHLGMNTGTNDVNFTASPGGQVFVAQTDENLTSAGLSSSIPMTNAAIANSLNVKGSRATYMDGGAVFDNGNWFGAAEYAQFRMKGWPQDYNSGYVSVGHYFGDLLPYVLLSRIVDVREQKSQDGVSNLGSIGSAFSQNNRKDQRTLAVGLRYQLRHNVSLKAQIDRISNFQGSNGLFTPASPQSDSLNSVYLYSLSLNTAF